MKRYHVCPIVGDGTFQNSYRAKTGDVQGVNINSLIPTHTTGPNIGKPKYGFAFCHVGAQGLGGVLQVTNSFTFPDYPLDGLMSGMEEEVRIGMKQSVEAYDLDGEGLHLDADFDLSESYRQVVERIAQQFEPAVNINFFDVSEPQE